MVSLFLDFWASLIGCPMHDQVSKLVCSVKPRSIPLPFVSAQDNDRMSGEWDREGIHALVIKLDPGRYDSVAFECFNHVGDGLFSWDGPFPSGLRGDRLDLLTLNTGRDRVRRDIHIGQFNSFFDC